MTDNDNKPAARHTASPGKGAAQPANEKPSSPRTAIEADIVPDEADWSAFGDVEAVVLAAAGAVSASPELALGPTEVTIALSSDVEVASLNGTYRGKPKPTNVLSFPAGPVPDGVAAAGGRFLGDIILARETILAEAVGLGIQPAHHLQHLVVHGILHLAGFDHETDEEAEAMEALETRILKSIGVSDPYTGGEA